MKHILMVGHSVIEVSAGNRPQTVLLVEDNRVSRLVTERLLSRWGYRVILATNGLDALRQVALEQPDLVLMNLHMPGMNGAEAARMIRRLNNDQAKMPIIAFSASKFALQPQDSPFTDFLVVPYMPEQLRNLLLQHLAEAGQEISRAMIQARLDAVSGKDQLFRRQLVELFAKNCQELIDELLAGHLDDPAYLRQVRHKHKSSLRLLELYSFEAALDNLQQMLDQAVPDALLLQQRKEAVIYQAESVIEELTLKSA